MPHAFGGLTPAPNVDPLLSPPGTAPGASGQAGAPRRARSRRLARMRTGERVALGTLVLLAVACAVGPFVWPHDPLGQQLDLMFASPSVTHPLGTDDLGRDVLARILEGGRVTVLSSAWATLVAIVLGYPLGLVSGYFGSWVDAILGRILDAFMAIPAIVFAVVAAAVLQGGVYGAMTSIGVVFAPVVARLVRAEVLRARESLFVEALTSLGVSRPRIILRHMVPNSLQPVIVQSSLIMAYALIAESSLSFLGFGIQSPDPSWGGILGRAYSSMSQHSWQIFVPGLCITVTVLCVNVMGGYMRRSFLMVED